jgi:tRNA A64-2'-O-ribosylphosphate transferase
VFPSEAAQISNKLPGFASTLSSLGLDISSLRERISKPLHPVFITPTSGLPDLSSLPTFEGEVAVWPVICLCASHAEKDDSDTGYIQGAGDDTEAWAFGLTSSAFWKNKAYLMAESSEEELRARIAEVMSTRTDGWFSEPISAARVASERTMYASVSALSVS